MTNVELRNSKIEKNNLISKKRSQHCKGTAKSLDTPHWCSCEPGLQATFPGELPLMKT